MDNKQGGQTITAIVPAYNEGPRLSAVLDVLTAYTGFREVIVVDDGSTDETGVVARRYDVRYVRNEQNMGKGKSMDIAVSMTDSDVLFFCDADMTGVSHRMIDAIVQPVSEGKADMFIGMMNRRIYFARTLMAFIPLLGGARAVRKTLWNQVPQWYKDRFRIEAALNFYAIHYGAGLKYALFPELGQTIKENKYGWREGMVRRMRMLYEITIAQARLEFTATPQIEKSNRVALFNMFASLVGGAAGILLLTSAYMGPVRFVLQLFGAELRRDSDAPFIYFLLRIAHWVSVDVLVIIGLVLLLFNIVFLIVSLDRAFWFMREVWQRKGRPAYSEDGK